MQLVQLLAFVGLAAAIAAPGGGPGRGGFHGGDRGHGGNNGGNNGGDHGGHGHGVSGPVHGPPTCGQAYEDCQSRGQNLCCQGHKGEHCHTMTQADCMFTFLLSD
jgi:hypothetical protein